MSKRTRHWWQRRTAKDAPSHLADQAYTTYGAWADGWNAAVQAYRDEIAETLRREGYRVEEP
jgi:alpha-amylase/alpha-mannosidase (GH57 family)